MKKTVLLLIVSALCSTLAYAGITTVMGAAVQTVQEVTSNILCEVDCPVFFDVQDSNPNLMVGGSTCVFSTSGGSSSTWTACATNPPDGAAIQGIAVTPSGDFIVAQNSAVGDCRIFRSSDQGATWQLRYSDTQQRKCRGNQINTGNMAMCNGNDCIVVVYTPSFAAIGTGIGVIRSTDGGTNWTPLMDLTASVFANYAPQMVGVGQWDLRDVDKAIIAGNNSSFGATTLSGVGTFTKTPFDLFSPAGCVGGIYMLTIARFISPCYDFATNTVTLSDVTTLIYTPSLPQIPPGLTLGSLNVMVDKGGDVFLLGKQSTVFGDCDTGQGVSVQKMATYSPPISVTWTQENCFKTTIPFTITGGQVKVVNGEAIVLLTNGVDASGLPLDARIVKF